MTIPADFSLEYIDGLMDLMRKHAVPELHVDVVHIHMPSAGVTAEQKKEAERPPVVLREDGTVDIHPDLLNAVQP